MRIVVLTDVHANLPALQAALAVIREDGYDLLVHTGDAVGIGPFPAECLDVLLALPRARLVMGNHVGNPPAGPLRRSVRAHLARGRQIAAESISALASVQFVAKIHTP